VRDKEEVTFVEEVDNEREELRSKNDECLAVRVEEASGLEEEEGESSGVNINGWDPE